VRRKARSAPGGEKCVDGPNPGTHRSPIKKKKESQQFGAREKIGGEKKLQRKKKVARPTKVVHNKKKKNLYALKIECQRKLQKKKRLSARREVAEGPTGGRPLVATTFPEKRALAVGERGGDYLGEDPRRQPKPLKTLAVPRKKKPVAGKGFFRGERGGPKPGRGEKEKHLYGVNGGEKM